MSYLDHVRCRASENPAHPGTTVLQELLVALEAGESFCLDRLYELPYGDFEVALGALREWWSCRRLDGVRQDF